MCMFCDDPKCTKGLDIEAVFSDSDGDAGILDIPDEIKKEILNGLKASGMKPEDFAGGRFESLDDLPIPDELKNKLAAAMKMKAMLQKLKGHVDGHASDKDQNEERDENFKLIYTPAEVLEAVNAYDMTVLRPEFQVGDIVVIRPSNPGSYKYPMPGMPSRVIRRYAAPMNDSKGEFSPDDMVLACAVPPKKGALSKIVIKEFSVDRQYFDLYDGEVYGGKSE